MQNRLLKLYRNWEDGLLFSKTDKIPELKKFQTALKKAQRNEIVEAILEMPAQCVGDRFLAEIAKNSQCAPSVVKSLQAKKDSENIPTQRFLARCIAVISSHLE